MSLLLKEINWQKNDIEKVLICSENIYPDNAFNYYYDKKGRIKDTSTLIAIAKSLRNSILGRFFPSIFKMLREKRLENLIIKGRKELHNKLKKIGFNNIPFEHVEHHLCHARAVYHSFANDKISGDSIIFTLDGAGDNTCSSVTYVNKKGVWNKIAETPLESSLGNIYSHTTKFLGMKPLEHEYKVMGLAAYSKQNYVNSLYEKIFKPVIWLDEKNNLVFKSKLNTNNFYDYLVENAIGERFDNIAGALQLMTENLEEDLGMSDDDELASDFADEDGDEEEIDLDEELLADLNETLKVDIDPNVKHVLRKLVIKKNSCLNFCTCFPLFYYCSHYQG